MLVTHGQSFAAFSRAQHVLAALAVACVLWLPCALADRAANPEPKRCATALTALDSYLSIARFAQTQHRIVIVTDAWNQTNGVVKTLEQTVAQLRALNQEVLVLEPETLGLSSFPLPGYSSIQLAYSALLPSRRRLIEDRLKDFHPDRIHIATEGPLGLAARSIARQNHWAFTSSFHTHYAYYANIYSMGLIPVSWTYKLLEKFHRSASRTLVTNPTMQSELVREGFKNTTIWGRGVDLSVYRRNPNAKADLLARQGSAYQALGITDADREQARAEILKGPVFVYFGRVSKEKSVEDFLQADLPGVKVVIGPGPDGKTLADDKYLRQLEQKFNGRGNIIFTGEQLGQTKIDLLSLCDVFVFPSRTDTFANVQIEAMALGLPVAAYRGTSSSGVITDGVSGALEYDLASAAHRALLMDRSAVAAAAQEFTPENALAQFVDALVPIAPVPSE